MMAFTRSSIWFAVFVLVVFLMGLATGITIDRFASPARRPTRAVGGIGAGPRPAVLADRMSRELDLSDAQKQQLEEIFKRAAGRLETFRRDSRQEFGALSRELDAEIEAVLTPEQREKFRQMRPGRRRPPRGHKPEGAKGKTKDGKIPAEAAVYGFETTGGRSCSCSESTSFSGRRCSSSQFSRARRPSSTRSAANAGAGSALTDRSRSASN
jgi:Spy/CpxP family protein refolding chaperone